MNTKAHDRMQAAEVMYLLENGWRRLPNTTPNGSALWTGLSDKYSHGVTQGHAVNAQKQHDRVSPKHPPTRRLVVEVTDKGVVHYEQVTGDDLSIPLRDYQKAIKISQVGAGDGDRAYEIEEQAAKNQVAKLEEQLRVLDRQLSDTLSELSTERSMWLHAELGLRSRLHDTEDVLAKSRAFNKNREAEHAEYTAKAAQLYTEVCLERNKLRSLNKDLSAEVLLRKTELLSVSSALEESKRAEAELRAQLIERATPEFMNHHMSLTRQVARLQAECHDLRQRNMALAGDMSVVRNSLHQANSELREALKDLKHMTEDKKAAATLSRQALDVIDRLQHSAGTKAGQ